MFLHLGENIGNTVNARFKTHRIVEGVDCRLCTKDLLREPRKHGQSCENTHFDFRLSVQVQGELLKFVATVMFQAREGCIFIRSCIVGRRSSWGGDVILHAWC
jgi:hypothetical protein